MTAQVRVFDRRNDELIGVLGAVRDAACRQKLNDPGDGSVKLLADYAEHIQHRRVVRLEDVTDDATTTVTAFTIEKISEVLVGKHHVDEVVDCSGFGLLNRLSEWLVLHHTDLDLPRSELRRFDWTAPEVDAESLWDATLYVQPRDNLLWGDDRPVAWPEPFGVWIHTLPANQPHPTGTQYYHRTFTLTSATEIEIFVSASDQFTVALDGTVLQQQLLSGPNSVWWWTWRSGVKLPAGTHTVRIRVDVVNPTGAAGVLCSGFTAGSVGIGQPVFLSGVGDVGEIDGGWFGIDNPDPAPGLTGTEIMRRLVEEAEARGCEVPALSFTDTTDSAGATVPIEAGFTIPAWSKVADAMKALGRYEFTIDPAGYELGMVLAPSGETKSAPLKVSRMNRFSTA